MRHLDGYRRAVDQHDLVAPVELVGLARREAQGHVGFRGRRTARGAPLPGIASYRIVAALVSEPAQLFENADQRQPLTTRLALVRKQQVIKLFAPRIDPSQRLAVSLVPELGRLRPNHLAHDFPRYPKLAADRLDRLLLGEIGPPDLRNRLHCQHPKTGSHLRHGSHCGPAVPGVPIGCRLPRKRGPYSTPIHIPAGAWSSRPLPKRSGPSRRSTTADAARAMSSVPSDRPRGRHSPPLTPAARPRTGSISSARSRAGSKPMSRGSTPWWTTSTSTAPPTCCSSLWPTRAGSSCSSPSTRLT